MFSDFNSLINSIFIDRKLLIFGDIIKAQQLNLVHEYFGKILPDDLHKLFDFSRDIHTTHLNLISARKNLLYP